MAKNKADLLTDEDMRPENIKANITIRISGDVLDWYRAEAAKQGIGYQTLMQMKLREGMSQLNKLIMDRLEKRIEVLETVIKMDIRDDEEREKAKRISIGQKSAAGQSKRR